VAEPRGIEPLAAVDRHETRRSAMSAAALNDTANFASNNCCTRAL
jgi:hypothetical protein